MAEQRRPVLMHTRLNLSVGVNFEAAALEAMRHEGGWPFGDNEPNLLDGAPMVQPDAFKESDEAKAIYARYAQPIIDQIAQARTEGRE